MKERRDFIRTGLNDRAHHPLLVGELERAVTTAPGFGVPNVIAMIGNRDGRNEEAGLEACVEGLNQVKALAGDVGRRRLARLRRVAHALALLRPSSRRSTPSTKGPASATWPTSASEASRSARR